MFKGKRILVVVAHPDDELLGLGATMHKLIKEEGVVAKAIILGEGITSRSDSRDVKKWKVILEKHHENMRLAAEIVGYKEVKCYNFSDNRFDSHALLDIVKVVEKEKEDFQPDIIFTHNGSDLNVDHQRTFEAVVTATRPMDDERVSTVVTFETPSATEWQASNIIPKFTPNLYVEVSDNDMKAKVDAMNCYEFETRLYPHPRSDEALYLLAKFRGMQVGKGYVEAFCLIRTIL